MAKDIRLVVRAKNNILLKAIEDAGYQSIAEFCRVAKVAAPKVTDIVNFKTSPTCKTGAWTPTVINLSEFLRVPPDELFSEWHLANVGSMTCSEIELASEDYVSLSRDGGELLAVEAPDSVVTDSEKLSAVERGLSNLPAREQAVLRMRTGIGFDEQLTLDEVASRLRVTRERVRQIEATAIRKLRLTHNAVLLREAYNG